MLVGCFLAAVVGDQVGYVFGQRVGPSLFRRPDSRLFKQENVDRAREFFDHHGSKTIVLARFVPVVRTFAPIVAGVSRMRYRTFVTFNVIGAPDLGRSASPPPATCSARRSLDIDKYLLPIIAIIIVASLVPVLIETRRARRRRVQQP